MYKTGDLSKWLPNGEIDSRKLEPKYSVYGIQPSGLSGKEPLPLSFYEMLSDYIKEIKSIQPEGPYLLGTISLKN